MELFNLIANHYKVERIPINLTWLCTYKTCKLLLETPSLPLNNAVDPRSSDSHYPGASYSIKQCVFGDEVVTRSRGGLGMLD